MADLIPVAVRGEIAEGHTKKFIVIRSGQEVEAFAVNFHGEFYAYVNECRHVPMTMDWVENQFLTEDRCFIQCATHGALFQPDTGVCIEGPPAGKALHPIQLEWQGDQLVALLPDAERDEDS